MKRTLLSLLGLFCLTAGSAWAQSVTPCEGDVWDEETKTLTINSNPGEWAYYETDILHLIIGKNVTEIGKWAFDSCSSLSTIEYEEGSTLEIIGKGAFSQCHGLTSITFPNTVTTISGYSFGDCRGLASVTIPNSVTTIGDAAFCLCNCLPSIIIPNSVTSIGFGAFDCCINLRWVIIGNGMTSIGEQAFQDNPRLKTFTLYSPSCTLGEKVFDDCDSLTHIFVLNDKVEAYKNAENWSDYADLITPIMGTGIGAIAKSQQLTASTTTFQAAA